MLKYTLCVTNELTLSSYLSVGGWPPLSSSVLSPASSSWLSPVVLSWPCWPPVVCVPLVYAPLLAPAVKGEGGIGE